MEKMLIANSWGWTVALYASLLLILGLLFYFKASIRQFFGEVKAELLKCSWPWDPKQTGIQKYRELIQSTVIVCVITFLLAAYTSTFDFLLNRCIHLIVRF